MRLVRNFRKSSVPIGKKMPHLRKGKATEYWPGFDKPGQSAVNLSGCVDLMSWWNENTNLYPRLSVVARNVLCVMATSAASERNFSLAGHVVSARRFTFKFIQCEQYFADEQCHASIMLLYSDNVVLYAYN